jgi:hypothetical protein
VAKPPLAYRARRRGVDDFDEGYEPRQPRRPSASNQAWKAVVAVIAVVLLLPCAGFAYFFITCLANL